jgi:hypothetical protein
MVVNDILGFIDLMGAIVANRYADEFRENPAFNIVKVLLFSLGKPRCCKA